MERNATRTHSVRPSALCVLVLLPSAVSLMCLHAQSEDPAVYASVFAILLGCLPPVCTDEYKLGRVPYDWRCTSEHVFFFSHPRLSSADASLLLAGVFFGVTHVP